MKQLKFDDLYEIQLRLERRDKKFTLYYVIYKKKPWFLRHQLLLDLNKTAQQLHLNNITTKTINGLIIPLRRKYLLIDIDYLLHLLRKTPLFFTQKTTSFYLWKSILEKKKGNELDKLVQFPKLRTKKRVKQKRGLTLNQLLIQIGTPYNKLAKITYKNSKEKQSLSISLGIAYKKTFGHQPKKIKELVPNARSKGRRLTYFQSRELPQVKTWITNWFHCKKP